MTRPRQRGRGAVPFVFVVVAGAWACRGLIGYEDGVSAGAASADATTEGGSFAPPTSTPQSDGAIPSDPDADVGVALWDGAYPDVTCLTEDAGSPRSCEGVTPSCGPNFDEDCCTAVSLDGGTFNAFDDPRAGTLVCPFKLDKFEVTVGRFRTFLQHYTDPSVVPVGSGKNPNDPSDPGWTTAHAAMLLDGGAAIAPALKCRSEYQTWTAEPDGGETRPINCVTWYEAAAFCTWDNGRLPTAAEWSFAAVNGAEQRAYPWGDAEPTRDDTLAIWGWDCLSLAKCQAMPVGTPSAGISAAGAADLAGNLWEWAADYSCPRPRPCINCACLVEPRRPSGSLAPTRRILGGGFPYAASYLSNAHEDSKLAEDDRNYSQGFRCARVP